MSLFRNKADTIRLLARRNWSFPNESGSNGLFGLHPYPAKFIPQIPHSLIQDIGIAEGGVVFDPFCGSGTTLIEAQALGYSSMGIDLNPIACLISKVATKPLPEEFQDVMNRCVKFAKSIKNPSISEIPNLDHWFKKPIQKSIAAILAAIENELCERARDTLRLALSSTIVRVSNQDSDTRYAAVEKRVSSSDVFELFRITCERYAQTLIGSDTDLPKCKVLCRDILDVKPEEVEGRIGLVVCSPPYPNAYEYWLYHKYRMWWLGYDPLFVKEKEIGARPHYFKKNHQTPDDFRLQMVKVFELLKKVCIENSYACFVIGDSKIHGEIIDNTELLCMAAEASNFETVAILNRDILLSRKSFNLANSRLKSENIIVFQKKRTRTKHPVFSANINWHSYRYFPYEKSFAFRELSTLPGIRRLEIKPDAVSVSFAQHAAKNLNKLVYFSDYTFSTGEHGRTLQAKLENGLAQNSNTKRQSTRYGVHGLHEYKGKFNPQIVRGILNAYCLKKESRILDPFCGSGTTLVESNISGFRATGWDMNPFAVYLTNAKLSAMHCNPLKIRSLSDKILAAYDMGISTNIDMSNTRSKYLSKWFPEENLAIIESLRFIIENEAGNTAPLFLIILSDILRDYSLQEPSDLRIRRRKSHMPKISIRERLESEFAKKLDAIQSAFEAHGPVCSEARAILADGRNWDDLTSAGISENTFDFALTSPPYATALPYIDTQRLSLVWLGLIDPTSIRTAEEALIGSREASNANLLSLADSLSRNDTNLPSEAFEYCKLLQKHVGDDDGFRRKAVPSLLYRYFSDMTCTFTTVKRVIKHDGIYALVVGTNRTTLGGTQFNIDTPRFLARIAEHQGWSILELLPLQTYKRYGLHSANAVQDEILIVLKNE